MTDFRIFSKVLVADIVSTHPGDPPVDNYDLTVVAKVDLEAISRTLAIVPWAVRVLITASTEEMKPSRCTAMRKKVIRFPSGFPVSRCRRSL
jgi:hypothetical protein